MNIEQVDARLAEITKRLIYLSNLNDVDDGDRQAYAAMQAYDAAANMVIKLHLEMMKSSTTST